MRRVTDWGLVALVACLVAIGVITIVIYGYVLYTIMCTP